MYCNISVFGLYTRRDKDDWTVEVQWFYVVVRQQRTADVCVGEKVMWNDIFLLIVSWNTILNTTLSLVIPNYFNSIRQWAFWPVSVEPSKQRSYHGFKYGWSWCYFKHRLQFPLLLMEKVCSRGLPCLRTKMWVV